MKKFSDKGFSLIEIVLAIAVLAVVIAPTLESFITSARINRDSRQIMVKTDIAQTVMEGFTDKSYAEIKNVLNSSLGVALLEGGNAFTRVNNGIYNTTEAYGGPIDSSIMDGVLSDVKQNSIIYVDADGYTQTIDTYNLYEDLTASSITANTTFIPRIRSAFYDTVVAASLNSADQKIYGWTDTSGLISCIGYTNVSCNGLCYDVIASFVPAAKNDDDTWFSYYVDVAVYEVNKAATDIRYAGNTPVMAMNSGIKNMNKFE